MELTPCGNHYCRNTSVRGAGETQLGILEGQVALFTFIGGLFYYIGENLMELTVALDRYTDSIDVLKLTFLVVAFFSPPIGS